MRHIIYIFSFVLATLYASNVSSQIEQISYALSFNESTSLYDFFLIINKGETSSNIHTIQFNSQVSMVVPHGASLEIANSYMPLIGNNNQVNRTPTDWAITDIITAPAEDISSDFYTLSPSTSQTSFYNQLSEGDKVKLFSVRVVKKENEVEKLRLYENGVDIRISDTDLSNGFSLGGANQLFSGIVKSGIEDDNEYTKQEND